MTEGVAGELIGPQQFLTPDPSQFIKFSETVQAETNTLKDAFESLAGSVGGFAQSLGQIVGQGGSAQDVLKKITETIIAGIPARVGE